MTGPDPPNPVPGGPPADPEDWDDDQWIAWLEATDEAPGADGPRGAQRPPTIGRGGAVLGQAMLGMARALYGQEEDELVVVAEGPADPGGPEDFAVRLDPDHPERSSVVFRRPRADPDPDPDPPDGTV